MQNEDLGLHLRLSEMLEIRAQKNSSATVRLRIALRSHPDVAACVGVTATYAHMRPGGRNTTDRRCLRAVVAFSYHCSGGSTRFSHGCHFGTKFWEPSQSSLRGTQSILGDGLSEPSVLRLLSRSV